MAEQGDAQSYPDLKTCPLAKSEILIKFSNFIEELSRVYTQVAVVNGEIVEP